MKCATKIVWPVFAGGTKWERGLIDLLTDLSTEAWPTYWLKHGLLCGDRWWCGPFQFLSLGSFPSWPHDQPTSWLWVVKVSWQLLAVLESAPAFPAPPFLLLFCIFAVWLQIQSRELRGQLWSDWSVVHAAFVWRSFREFRREFEIFVEFCAANSWLSHKNVPFLLKC